MAAVDLRELGGCHSGRGFNGVVNPSVDLVKPLDVVMDAICNGEEVTHILEGDRRAEWHSGQ